MKQTTITSFFIAVLIFFMQPLHGQGLTIIDQDYEMAKAESQRQHKLLLIDFYTTWCVPCKVIDKMIFRDTIVSNAIAKDFILLKYDAGKDSIHQLTLKHHISLYPTTMVLNLDQRVLNRLYGFGGPEKDLVKNYRSFLDTAIAGNATDNYLKGVSNVTRLDYPKFYRDFVNGVNTTAADSNVAVYWKTNTDYFGEVPFALLNYFEGGTDEVNKIFLANRKKYEELYGKQDVRFVISMMVTKHIYAAFKTKDRASFNKWLEVARQNFDPKGLPDYTSFMEEKMLESEGRWADALGKFEVRRKKPGFDDESMNSYCWSMYQNCNDKKVLKKCAEWMKEVTARTPTFAMLDTYARVLYKSGNKEEALVQMKKAIEAGKLNKEDTAASEKWLKVNG